MSAQQSDVRVGDVWADNDPRGGPTCLVVRICDGTPGGCQPLSRHVDHPHVHVTGEDGKRPRTILLRRFRPTRSGYRLIERRGSSE